MRQRIATTALAAGLVAVAVTQQVSRAAASAALMMLRLPMNDVSSRMKISTVPTAESPSVPKWMSFCRFWTFAENMVEVRARVCVDCGAVDLYADTKKLKRLVKP